MLSFADLMIIEFRESLPAILEGNDPARGRDYWSFVTARYGHLTTPPADRPGRVPLTRGRKGTTRARPPKLRPEEARAIAAMVEADVEIPVIARRLNRSPDFVEGFLSVAGLTRTREGD